MPYRRTDNVVRRMAARRAAILRAARQMAAEGGMGSVQIAAVAERTAIATGTVYRYFPSKSDLVAALIASLSEEEIAILRRAAAAAPGPLSALSATIATFASQVLRHRKLAWALTAEPVDSETDAVRLGFRRALTAELEARIAAAMAARHFPEQDARRSATALVGALLDGLLGPLAPEIGEDGTAEREAVQALTLLSLRALGVVDARARGLVVQIALPARERA